MSHVSIRGSNKLTAHPGPTLLGLALKRKNLTTISLLLLEHQGGWLGFQHWCKERNLDPLSYTVMLVLSFLQCLVGKRLVYPTIKVIAAAISFCHDDFGNRLIFSHPTRKCFLQGVKRQCPVMRESSLHWELQLEADEPSMSLCSTGS